MTEDPTDRRAKLVRFTEAGMVVAADGKRHMYALEQQWQDKFGAENYEIAREVLEGIVEMMTRED